LALGATNAAKAGMGGVFFTSTGNCCYWQEPFPVDVQTELVSTQNLTGGITNSDLEQEAAMLAQQLDVIPNHLNVTYATLKTLCDNTPAVSCTWKGAVSSPGPAAYLCQVTSDHQCLHRYHHRAAYLLGPQNVMADDCSRLQQLTDCAFHAHMLHATCLSTGDTVAHAEPAACDEFVADCRAALNATNNDIVPKTQKRSGVVWNEWVEFCTRNATPPDLQHFPTHELRLWHLLVFGWRHRTTRKGKASKPISELTRWRQPSKLLERGSPNWASKIHGS
jgi:hypothetical protein